MDSDLRIGEFLAGNKPGSGGAALIGFPVDEGVIRNNGRPGAREAPEQILSRLLQLTPHPKYYKRHTACLGKVFNAGIIQTSGKLEENQAALSQVISEFLEQDVIPIVIGGGHEASFGHFSGYAESGKEVSIINIDAHTDVRPLLDGKPHSGSPFRQILEHSSALCWDYSVFGLNPESVSRDHYHFVAGHGGELRFRDNTDLDIVLNHLNSRKTDHIMVTMDMDAVSQSAAPGVSAPAASGLSPDLWLKLAYEFGKYGKVSSFDLCEVNPRFDIDGQTVRLAALTIWYFLLGLALRDV